MILIFDANLKRISITVSILRISGLPNISWVLKLPEIHKDYFESKEICTGDSG